MDDEILVYAELQNGKLGRPGREAIAAGQALAADFSARTAVALLGNDVAGPAAEIAEADVSSVVACSSPFLAEYTPDGYAHALGEIILERRPRFVIFSHTYQARDFVPKLAAALDRALASDCLGYRKVGEKAIFVRQVFQGKFSADIEFTSDPPHLVSFQAAAFREDAVRKGSSSVPVTEFSTSVKAEHIRTKPGERFREAKQAVDLSQAEAIVAVGRGIKAPENLELVKKLAEALGAEIGASRPVCDSGWLPMDRQIGSSGQTVAPRLYLALGISGAIQHLVGMKGSRTVVAVNKDKEAPIFEVATYGIVGDLFEILPPLIEEVRKAKGS